MDPKLTAYGIARVRSEEGVRPPRERLFVDPYAHLFDDRQIDVDSLWSVIPFFREHVRLRTRFIDDAVREALVAGTRDIVILGAGFDSRALRMKEIAEAGARVVEVDQAEQVESKRQRLARANVVLPASLRFAAADLSSASLEESWRQALGSVGVVPESRVLWIAEGLLGYLPQPAVARLARLAHASSGTGSTFVANHYVHTWSTELLVGVFREAGWAASPGPSFEEMHRSWIGPDVPRGSHDFAIMVAKR